MASVQFVLRWDARRPVLLLGVLAVAVMLSACDDEVPEATVAATAVAGTAAASTPVTGGGAADAPQNVDQSGCDEIEPLVTSTFAGAFPGAELIRDATAFEAGGGSLVAQGCRVMVLGDGDELPAFAEVASALRSALEAEGWQEDSAFAADGPTATMSLLRRGEEMALVAAGVSPVQPGVCPSSQPIGECLEGLESDEVVVQGSIVLAVSRQ